MAKLNRADVKFDTMRGSGPGGQHRNRTDSCVRATHKPTGISVTIDGRSQGKNKALALKELQKRLDERENDAKEQAKKATRDKRIKEERVIKTYSFVRGVVTDHRTGKVASLKDVLTKGKIEKLR